MYWHSRVSQQVKDHVLILPWEVHSHLVSLSRIGFPLNSLPCCYFKSVTRLEIDISSSGYLKIHHSLFGLWHKSNNEENTLIVLSLLMWWSPLVQKSKKRTLKVFQKKFLLCFCLAFVDINILQRRQIGDNQVW